MTDYRAPRFWHIEERFGYFYPTNQYGGFFCRTRTIEGALAAVNEEIAAHPGDSWSD